MKQEPPSERLSSDLSQPGVTERFQILLGRRIRDKRRAKHLTQAALANSVGMARAAIANIEIGRQRTSVTALARLAHALESSPGSLIPEMSEALEQWNTFRQAPVSTKAPLLAKELREYNISPENRETPEKVLADIRAARKDAGGQSDNNRKGETTKS